MFLFEKRISGCTNSPPVTITLGAFPAICIEDARQEARRLSTLCEKGQDPRLVSKNREEKPGLLLETAIDKFFSLKKDLRPRTLQKYLDVIKLQFPDSWMRRDLTTLTPDMVVEQFHIARITSRDRCWEFLKVFTNIWNTCKPYFRVRQRNPILEQNPIPEALNMLKYIKRDPRKRSVIPKNLLGKFVATVEKLRGGQILVETRQESVAVAPIVVRMCDIASIWDCQVNQNHWGFLWFFQEIHGVGRDGKSQFNFINFRNLQIYFEPIFNLVNRLAKRLFFAQFS